MKYFTPELYNRGNSDNDDEVDGVEYEWDRRIERYHRRWRKIKAAFPEGVRRFEKDHICLHDAEVFSIGRDGNTLVMLLKTEPPACEPVVLTFTLTEEPVITTGTITKSHEGRPIFWLYEEWDIDRQKRMTFEVLLSNGWVVKLYFRDFHYLIANPVFPPVAG